LTYFWRRGK